MPLGQARRWAATVTYGLAHFGKSLFWYASEILFAYYLTELVGLHAVHMGFVLGLGLMASALFDLIVGARLRFSLSDARRAARMQFVGSLLCAASFIAVFAGFWVPQPLRFSHAMITGLAFRLAFTLYDLPQNALMTVGTGSMEARDRLAATRIFFSGLATLTVALCVAPLLVTERQGEIAPRYLVLACATAVPAVVSAGALSRLMLRTSNQSPKAAVITSSGFQPSATFWLLIGVASVTSLLTPIFGKLEPYFATFVLRSPVLGGVIVTATALGTVIGQPIWRSLRKRWTLPAVMSLAATAQIVGLLAFWVLVKRPDFGLAFAAGLFGLGSGGIGTALWAAFSEAAAREACGREGLAWAVFGATVKMSLALGALMLGALLMTIEYRDAEGASLTWLMVVVPAVGALACIALAVAWSEVSRPQGRFAR